MAEGRINERIVICLIVITASVNILIYIGEIHNGILPKFISSSYKDNLKLEFNSIFLKQIFNTISKFFNIKPSTTSFLIGDLPIYPNTNANESTLFKFKEFHQQEQEIIKNISYDKNNIKQIPITNNAKYFLFPNHDKTKMNVVLFSLEKVNKSNKQFDIIFPKLSQISLYEIPINNFIINYQSEFNLKNSFFKLKWKIDLPGIITKYAFSNDYEQLAVVYKNITKYSEIKYNIVYININKDNINGDFYDIVKLLGNLKIEAIAVHKNIIIYSRKYDIYKLNFLIKDNIKNNREWINIPKMKRNAINEPYNKISNLKFISKNKNDINDNKTNINDNDIYLFIKGVHCNLKGVFLYMKLINLDLNKLVYQNIKKSEINITNETMNQNSNVIYINNVKKYNISKIIKESVMFYHQPLIPSLFEGKNYNIYDNNYTYNMDNLELDKLNLYLRNIHSYTVFNKYLQKSDKTNTLEFRFLSNFNTYNTLSMNSSYFKDIKSINYTEDDFLIKTDESSIVKICGKEDNYIVEDNNNKLAFGTRLNSKKEVKKGDDIEYFDIRRISFVSLPKCFKPTIIHDYYFDIFDGKYILILLIDDGILLSLDFTRSIKNKNNSAVFYMDIINNKKILMLTINLFFLFFYFLDWSHFDQISINIRECIINFVNNTDNQFISENNFNGFNNELNLSNSNLSLLSNTSNDYTDDNNNSHNNSSNNLISLDNSFSNNSLNHINNNQEVNNNRRLRRQNHDQRSILEDILGIFPY